MFAHSNKCRACGANHLVPVFDLGLQPPSNDFCLPDEPRAGFAPLKILFCENCTLSQLSVVVDPNILYSNYKYVTSSSNLMRRHFDRLFQDLTSEGCSGTMVEIGSNDGTLLKFAKEKGYKGVGIDPANNLGEIARENGIRTITGCLNESLASHAKEVIGSAPSVILARHCFAHVDNWMEFVSSLEVMSDSNTLIAIEVPYVHDMLAKAEFDTVYHEHLSYMNLKAVSALLKGSPFHIHRVIRYGIHGGSLLIMLRHNDSSIKPHLSADEYLSEDKVTREHWERFSIAAKSKINKLRELVDAFNSKGKRVFAFGASAKASVWINACGFTSKDLLFVTDNSPLKPGRLVPGTDIPVISEELLLSEHPDVAFLSAWNYAPEILEKHKKWRERGGKFMIPTPQGIEVV